MEWSALQQSPENLNKIKKLQRDCLNLSDEVFQADLFLKPDISAQVIAYLAEKYELNTQRGFHVALNNCYTELKLGLPTPYAQRITEINSAYMLLQKAKDTSVSPEEYQHYAQLIDDVLSRDHGIILGIKVMCAILKYRVNVSLVEMINATLRPSDNYYDGTTWTISKLVVPVPDGFNVYMRPLLGDRAYLVVDSHGGKKYNQIKSLSKSFDQLTGKGFLKVRHILGGGLPASTVLPAIPAKAKEKLKVKLKPKEEVGQVDFLPTKKLKVKVKVKAGLQAPSDPQGHAWEFFYDPLLKPVSNEKDQAHMKRLTKYVCGSTDQFYPSLFENAEGYDKVVRYFTEEKINAMTGKPYCLSWETQKTYIGALCKYLKLLANDFTPAMYDRYVAYADHVKVRLLTDKREKPPVVDFPTFLPILRKLILDKKKVAGFRILCSMLVHNLDIADDEGNAVLRMTDVQNTRFTNDGEHSYIDPATQTWHIAPTKRVISLPPGFIADLRVVYGPSLPEWLLVDKAGLPYDKMGSLSNMFQRFVGVTYSSIRESCAAYRNSSPKSNL